MLKKQISYEDLDGNVTSETLYFNLSKLEALKLEAKYPNGLEAEVRKIQERDDWKEMLDIQIEILGAAYGERSEDGKRLVKTPAIREAFLNSLAFEQFFTEIIENPESLEGIYRAIFPFSEQAGNSNLQVVK